MVHVMTPLHTAPHVNFTNVPRENPNCEVPYWNSDANSNRIQKIPNVCFTSAATAPRATRPIQSTYDGRSAKSSDQISIRSRMTPGIMSWLKKGLYEKKTKLGTAAAHAAKTHHERPKTRVRRRYDKT